MQVNVIVVYNLEEDKILFCKRNKNPYKGLYNFVGGKVEKGEDKLESAYRELSEETGIHKTEISLINFMTINYRMDPLELDVYVGKLSKEVSLIEEANPLVWMDVDEDFFDQEKYAGAGNIGHILHQVNQHKEKLFNR